MIKELIKLAADLDRLGFHREADFVDSRIQKLSAYIHGETGEETGTTVEESPLSEKQIFRVRSPRSLSQSSEIEEAISNEPEATVYYVLESVLNTSNPNVDFWKIHSGYGSREEAVEEMYRLHGETGKNFRAASPDAVEKLIKQERIVPLSN